MVLPSPRAAAVSTRLRVRDVDAQQERVACVGAVEVVAERERGVVLAAARSEDGHRLAVQVAVQRILAERAAVLPVARSGISTLRICGSQVGKGATSLRSR